MPGDSKTEKATPKKRRDERKKGNIFLSKDIIGVVSLLGIFYILKILFPYIYSLVKRYLLVYFDYMANVTDVSETFVKDRSVEFMFTILQTAMPLLLASVVIAIITTGVQTKFIFTASNFAPKFNRLSPLKGIKKLFSLKNIIEVLKGLIKISILIYLIYTIIEGEFTNFPRTLYMDIPSSTVYMLDAVMNLIIKVSIAFAVIAGFDYFYQWWDYERQMKMSKQELKEEYKQTEGNPEIKGKIRQMQRQRAMNRMMQSVPQADVVIRNPTHFAVALKYDLEKDNAPILLAKGQDELALRIVRVAEENGISVIENKPLARGIYAATGLNSEIPAEYYGTVAEILVYVYKLNNKQMN